MAGRPFRFLLCALLSALFLPGCSKRTLVLFSQQENGPFSVTVEQVGDPVFPYGETSCEVILYEDGTVLKKESFKMKNDGKNAGEDDFTVIWNSDSADLIISAEEEEEKTIRLPLH